jgi:FkbH-like protein
MTSSANTMVSDTEAARGITAAAGLRPEVDRLIAEGKPLAAASLLAELWARESTASTASFVVSRFEQFRSKLNLVPYRVAVLRSYTVEPIVPLVRAAAFCAGLDLTIHLSDFNTHVQEILDASSPLYRFTPDAVILAVQTRDVAPDLWRDFADLDAAGVHRAVDRVVADFNSWISNFRNRSNAHVIVHNLEQPVAPSQGLLDAQLEASQAAAIQKINQELRRIAAANTGVYLLDYDALVARHGRKRWHDERKWLTVRLPIAAENLNLLAAEWLRFLHPLSGKIAKGCVVDLDNTLWGGVIGEDGMAGIKLGSEYPGAAFRDLQRVLLDLHQRGILLAICSKNNRDDAMEAIEKHPGMLLKPEHFAAVRINWTDKAQNLREIAHELNIGVDALAFVDDNRIERQQVRSQLPEVYVIELPADPMQFAPVLRQSPLFERLALSAEDRQRGAMYQEQREREQLEQSVTSREDFYRSLQQEVEIAPVSKATLARVAQLTNKTNQFNLTTRRYTEQQIWEMAALPNCGCFSLGVRDRFGDNGLVGVAITRQSGDVCEIDSFLLSCRVIGRTVETAFLSFLAEHARQRGARRLEGWFLPTKKNAPAKEFYPSHGFTLAKDDETGTLWSLDLSRQPLSCPEWVKLNVMNGDRG